MKTITVSDATYATLQEFAAVNKLKRDKEGEHDATIDQLIKGQKSLKTLRQDIAGLSTKADQMLRGVTEAVAADLSAPPADPAPTA